MQRNTILAASLAVSALLGQNTAHAEDTVAVIVKATTSEYWQWVFKGAEDAGKQLGVSRSVVQRWRLSRKPSKIPETFA